MHLSDRYYIFGEFTIEEAKKFVEWIHNWEHEKPRDLVIIINSFGGSAYALMSMLDAMASSNHRLITVGTGCIMSSGFILFIAGRYRLLHRTCSCLSHKVHGVLEGNNSEIKNDLGNLEFMQQSVLNIYKANSNLTKKFIETNLLKHEDVYISPEDMLKYKLADELI